MVKVKVKSLSPRLLATPWTAAHQAPLSMGFSRQEYWSGEPLPSPGTQFRWSQFCWQHPKHHSQEPVEHMPSFHKLYTIHFQSNRTPVQSSHSQRNQALLLSPWLHFFLFAVYVAPGVLTFLLFLNQPGWFLPHGLYTYSYLYLAFSSLRTLLYLIIQFSAQLSIGSLCLTYHLSTD